MVRHVLSKASKFSPAALVASGWVLFIEGLAMQNLVVKTILLSVARVLPQTLHVSSRGTGSARPRLL